MIQNPAQMFNMFQQKAQHSEHTAQKLPSLYVGDLDRTVYDSELYNFFNVRGFRPHKAKVIMDKVTNAHKGFGLVQFLKQEDADKALE